MWNLQPRALENRTLEEAMEEEVTRFIAEGQEKASFNLVGQPCSVPSDVQTALFRICQESLSNVKQHAGATEVSVTLTFLPEYVGLEVNDNGKGFDPQEQSASSMHGGFGFKSMTQRAQSLGGDITVKSQKGNGTRVEAKIPMA